MTWEIEFYDHVEEDILAMTPGIQARMLRLLEMVEVHGANLGMPHTKSLGDGLFEIRAKAKEGIGRGIFCYMDGQRVKVLHAFTKKDQRTPKKDLDLAKERLLKVKQNESSKAERKSSAKRRGPR